MFDDVPTNVCRLSMNEIIGSARIEHSKSVEGNVTWLGLSDA